MKIHHQLVLGTLADNALIVIDHPLVAVVHEVDFQSLHTHLCIIRNQIHVVLYREPRQP